MPANGRPEGLAGPIVQVALTTSGGVTIKTNCELDLSIRMLGQAIVPLCDQIKKAQAASAQGPANDESQAQLDEAVAHHGEGTGGEHAQLLRVLAALLQVRGVPEDLPGTLEEQREVVVRTAEALKIEDPGAAEAALPLKDVLGYLLAATRLKRTRGLIAMAKSSGALTPSECASDLLKMRAEWRKLSALLGDTLEFPDEEA